MTVVSVFVCSSEVDDVDQDFKKGSHLLIIDKMGVKQVK